MSSTLRSLLLKKPAGWLQPVGAYTSILLCLLGSQAVAQQRSAEDILKELKRMELEGQRAMDSLKAAANNMNGQVAGSNGKATTTIPFPKPNKTLLAALEKDTLSAAGFPAYVLRLYKQLESGLTPQQKKNISNINPQIARQPQQLGQLAVLSWYNGGTVEAAVLAAKALTLQGAGSLEGNNLGAILVMGGAAEKAIPALQYLLSRSPNNVLLLNNLAQAYASLGGADIAKRYIDRCLQLAPQHPEANLTAARIAAAQGNRQAAIDYTEASLEGACTTGAIHLLNQLQPPRKHISELLSKVNLPDAFNAYKFELPRQQQLLNEGAELQAAQVAFRNAVDDAMEKLQAIIETYETKGEDIIKRQTRMLQQNPMAYMKNPYAFKRPLMGIGFYMMNKFMASDQEDRWEQQLQQTLKELKEKLKLKIASSNGNCVAIDAATTDYLKAKAVAITNWQEKKKNEALKIFFLESKLNYLSAPEKNLAIAGYYKAATIYLSRLKSLAVFEDGYSSYCNPGAYFTTDSSKLLFEPEPDCPVSLEIPFIVGSLKLNCDEASFEISAGASFSVTKNFASRQSTLSVGIGIDAKKEVELPGIAGEVGASANQSLFLTIDASNTIVDAGMQFGLGLSAGSELKVDLPQINASKELGEKKAEVGYTIGINSGFEFNEGPLKDLLNKGEQQLNPKIKVYKK